MIWVRFGLIYIVLSSLFVGLWAQFWPGEFYSSFPGFGRAWISIDGPFNEHLIRDVGGLNLGLGLSAVLALAFPQTRVIQAVCVTALAFGLPHYVYHLEHLSALPHLSDRIANVMTLGLNVTVPAVLVAFVSLRRIGTVQS
jgi:hypothetical protein